MTKSGSRLKESAGPRTFFTARQGRILGTQVKIGELAGALSRLLDRPVVDRSALGGTYDVRLEWTPDSVTSDLGVSVFTALQEQLGLRLESTRARVDVLVVDRVERPTEN